MGSDRAPGPEVAGALRAAAASQSDDAALAPGRVDEIILVGDEARIRAELAQGGSAEPALPPGIAIVGASERVAMSDPPGQVFRQKPDSSLRVAVEMVARGEADAVVSAGSSGAVLSHALFVLGRIPGVERPGIAVAFPDRLGGLVLCDAGANIEVKPSMLARFAIMGACYSRVIQGRAAPRVGILANGEELEKGTEITRAAHALLRSAADMPSAEFVCSGYVEASHLFDGAIDVVATDGYIGNVILKLAEGLGGALLDVVRAQLASADPSGVGGDLAALRGLGRAIDYAETGGALLAGVPGVVTLCHGRSDALAICNAIGRAAHYARRKLPACIGQAIAKAQSGWPRESRE